MGESGPSSPSAPRRRSLLSPRHAGGSTGACDNYRVNMQAASFGECMCGRPRAEHTEEALQTTTTKPRTFAKTKSDEELLEEQERRLLHSQELGAVVSGYCCCGGGGVLICQNF